VDSQLDDFSNVEVVVDGRRWGVRVHPPARL